MNARARVSPTRGPLSFPVALVQRGGAARASHASQRGRQARATATASAEATSHIAQTSTAIDAWPPASHRPSDAAIAATASERSQPAVRAAGPVVPPTTCCQCTSIAKASQPMPHRLHSSASAGRTACHAWRVSSDGARGRPRSLRAMAAAQAPTNSNATWFWKMSEYDT